MSDYQVVMDSAVVDVTIGDGAEMQVEQALQYVRSGQKEIDSYVEGVSKPALDEYVTSEKEPELDAYCRVKEQEIDTYVDEVNKPALDEYVVKEKEPEIAAYVENTIKPDVRAFAVARTEEFDANAADKQALVDAKALEAANSAAAALQSEKNAAASMTAAAASAQSAAGAMSAAQTSETNAKASENRCEDIFERLGTVIKIKGRVDTFEELPTTGNLDGDAYLVGVAGLMSYPEYYWFSDHWEYLGTSTDKIEWGTLQGDIAKQPDLQQALDEKANNSNVTAELAKKQNNLSAAQLAACNSGITAAKVGTYDGYAAQIASKAADSDVVHKTGSETKTGNLALQNGRFSAYSASSSTGVDIVRQDTARSDAVEKDTVFGNIHFNDKNNQVVGYVQTYRNSNGDNNLQLAIADADGNMKVLRVQSDGLVFVPKTPAVTDKTQAAVTTNFVANKFQVVDALPAEPVKGVFYFVKE